MKKTFTKLTVLSGLPMALLSCLLLFGTTTAIAQSGGLANDECDFATVLTPGATCTTIVGDNLGASASPQAESCSGTYNDDVWFQFDAVATDAVVNVTGSVSFDAIVQVSGGTCAAPVVLDCVDNTADGGLETVSLTGLTIGDTYFVRVADYSSFTLPTTTTFDICVVSAAPLAPCDMSAEEGQWPVGSITPDAGGALTTIATDQYEGSEYSVLTGIVSGNYYQIEHAAGSYITVREGAVDGAVLASGFSPLAFNAASTSDLYVHWTLDEFCAVGGTTGSFLTTVQDFGLPPCDMSSEDGQWPGSSITPDAGGAVTNIATNQYAGSEYSIITGILDVHEYEFTHAAGSYITVRIGAVDGPLLGSGFSPLMVQATSTSDLYVHWTLDEFCAVGGTTGSFLTTVQDFGVPPCDNTVADGLYPADPVTPDAGGAVTTIAVDQYSGSEYSVITGVLSSSTYEFTHANGSYITVRVGAVDGPVLGAGFSPLSVSAATTDDLYVHWNLDEFCAVSNDPFGATYETTVQLTGSVCLAEAGTLTTLEPQVCFPGALVAVADDAPVVPTGYVAVYVITDGAGNVVAGPLSTPEYTPTAAGTFVMHTLVLDPADQPTILGEVGNGAQAVADLFQENGGALCGSLDLTGVTFTSVVCPANDLCANAQAIACGDVVAGTNVGATEQDVTTYNALTVGAGVWYTFTGTGGDVTLSTCDDADFDTEINVITTADCVDYTNNVAGNDDGAGCGGFTSEVTFTTTIGQTYYVYVSDYASGGSEFGTFNLTLTCDPVTGINEVANADINVYPNPSNGEFVVEIRGVEADVQLNVLDLAGRVVYTEGAVLNGDFRRSMNLDVATGTYLLQIATEEGLVTRKIQIH